MTDWAGDAKNASTDGEFVRDARYISDRIVASIPAGSGPQPMPGTDGRVGELLWPAEPGRYRLIDAGQTLDHVQGQLDALFQREQGILLGAGGDGNDHLVEQSRGAFDQIAMALGNRVEGTWVQHSVHRVVLAGIRWGVGWYRSIPGRPSRHSQKKAL
mgnify:CR=1 FL=1